MRDGIKTCPKNWSNCSMYVEDLVSPCTNITAEIPKSEVNNFVIMCRMFSTHMQKCNDINLSLPNVSCMNRMSQNFDYNDIKKEMIQIRSHVEARRSSEMEICALVKNYINQIDPSLNMNTFVCGSTKYGITLLNANVSLVINTSKDP